MVEVDRSVSADRILTKAPKSISGQRVIPISSALKEYLKRAHTDYLLQKLKMGKDFFDGDYVVCQENGKPYKPNSLTSKFNDFLKKNNLKHIRLHDLRHPYVKLKLKFLLTQHYRCIGAKVLDFPLNFKPVVGVNIHLVYKHICECLCQGVFLFHCFCCLQSF